VALFIWSLYSTPRVPTSSQIAATTRRPAQQLPCPTARGPWRLALRRALPLAADPSLSAVSAASERPSGADFPGPAVGVPRPACSDVLSLLCTLVPS